MSLETAIQNAAEAMTELTKVMGQLLAQGGTASAAPKADKPAAKADKPAAAAKAEKPAAKGKAKKEEVEEEEEEEDFGEGDDVSIDDVRTALSRYSKFDSKPAAIEILKKYTKSGRVDQLDEGDYATIVEELEGLMA